MPAGFAYAPGGVLTIEDNLAKLSNLRLYDRKLLDKENFVMYYIVDRGNRVSNQTTNMSEISSFLAQAKNLLAAGNYVFVPRRKNLQALSDHGLTVADAKSEIMDLVVGDYYKGPKKDFEPDQPGDIWEFKKTVDGEQFYVKLKIQNRNGKDVLKCLSFHEDDFS